MCSLFCLVHIKKPFIILTSRFDFFSEQWQSPLFWISTPLSLCVPLRIMMLVCTLTSQNTSRGFGAPTAKQHNMFPSEKLASFFCAPDGVRTRAMESIGSWAPMLYPLSHPRHPRVRMAIIHAHTADDTSNACPVQFYFHFLSHQGEPDDHSIYSREVIGL